MRRVWELSESERIERQEGRLRKMLIGAWAPREPEMVELLLNLLKYEKKYPLSLVHRIIDRVASMAISTMVVTHDEVIDFIKGIPDGFAIARGPCACRINTAEALGPDARNLPEGNFDLCRQTSLDVDIQIAKCGEYFGELESYRRIDKEELLDLEEQCRDMGLVPNIYVFMGGEGGICHCSSRTCAPLLANEAIGGKSRFLKKGLSRPRTRKGMCSGTGHCVKVCHFGARQMVEEKGKMVSTMESGKCYGCGICAYVCPEGAIEMVPLEKNNR